MTEKTACAEGAGTDPYLEGLRVVWHDPTSYDPTKHAPPYMPSKTASVPTLQDVSIAHPLFTLLVLLRVGAFLHQSHHWFSSGPSSYADHLLFERLYNDSLKGIDQLAERAVGVLGSADPWVGSPQEQAVGIAEGVRNFAAKSNLPEDLVSASLHVEEATLKGISMFRQELEGARDFSIGIDNLLQGLADQHEEFVYLLKRRSSPDSYHYQR